MLAAIHRRKPDRKYERKLDAEARLIKLPCNDLPEGNARWTLHLLADELVALNEIDFESISHETVRERIKNTLKPHLSGYWEILPEQDADFVYYSFDESSKALRGHECDPLPGEPGAVARVDHRYKRNGKQRLHITTEPLTGWVAVEVTERRRTTEWIDLMVELADVHHPDAICIRVVMDQLNTHKPATFYDFFSPAQAKAYLDRFEFHYTPKRGSWLNMAEIKIGVLKRQCLDRRIYDASTLRAEVAAWENRHNAVDWPTDWQFITGDARIKLRQLYPVEPRN